MVSLDCMEAKFEQIPEKLWEQIEPLLPVKSPSRRGGRPRLPDRPIFAGILYRLRTGCQWKALPREFGAGSTVHHRYQAWCKAGVLEKIIAKLLHYYDQHVGLDLTWCSLDSAIVKAPKGG